MKEWVRCLRGKIGKKKEGQEKQLMEMVGRSGGITEEEGLYACVPTEGR